MSAIASGALSRSPRARWRRASSAAVKTRSRSSSQARQAHGRIVAAGAAHDRVARRSTRPANRRVEPARRTGVGRAARAGSSSRAGAADRGRRRARKSDDPDRRSRRTEHRPVVTSRMPTWSRALIANAATMPRAPVIAFQPAIAAAREASEVWSLIDGRDPDIDRGAGGAAGDRGDPQEGDVRRDRVRDERDASPSVLPRRIGDERAAPIRDLAPERGTRRSSRRRRGRR